MNNDLHHFSSDISCINKSTIAPHQDINALYIEELTTAIPTYRVLRLEGEYKNSFSLGERLDDTNLDDLLEMEFNIIFVKNIPFVKE